MSEWDGARERLTTWCRESDEPLRAVVRGKVIEVSVSTLRNAAWGNGVAVHDVLRALSGEHVLTPVGVESEDLRTVFEDDGYVALYLNYLLDYPAGIPVIRSVAGVALEPVDIRSLVERDDAEAERYVRVFCDLFDRMHPGQPIDSRAGFEITTKVLRGVADRSYARRVTA